MNIRTKSDFNPYFYNAKFLAESSDFSELIHITLYAIEVPDSRNSYLSYLLSYLLNLYLIRLCNGISSKSFSMLNNLVYLKYF